MLNWWLILLIVVIPIVVILLAVYILIFFQNKDDAKSDIGYKVIFVLAMVVGLGSVLLLPYDVANSPDPTQQTKYNQTLNTQLMWEVVLWMMAALAVVICPFLMFFYEAYDPEKPKIGKQIAHGIVSTLIIFVIFALVTGLCYWKVGVSQIKFEAFATGPQLLPVTNAGILNNGTYEDATLVINVTFTTYCMGMLCFFGWIFFFFYGGVGVTSYPIRKLLAFPKRVKRIGSSRFTQEMAIILAKAEALLELSLQLQKQCRSRISRPKQE
ncbi:LMBR1 domain-containing protein 1 [Angomonas deanei]|nr:LMBR1 domain-containing protein 1 [Angomonas deanei]|eukprot:EPY41028.1 LMBR1 domain-containing protein 1 [Angomonas deanei]